MLWAAIAQSVLRLATGWTVRGSNGGGSEIFRTRPHRPCGPPSNIYNGYRVSFPGVKRPGSDVNHPPPSSADVKERINLYLYSPSGTHGLLQSYLYLYPYRHINVCHYMIKVSVGYYHTKGLRIFGYGSLHVVV